MFEYDVAISFAGEQRREAEGIASRLRAAGVSVFYDAYEQADLWGKNLYDHLATVYQHKARYCLMLVSAGYAAKVWTTHERQSAQARALEQNTEYILPVRFDDTEIPGLLSTIGYVRLADYGAEGIADLVIQKLGKSARPPAAPALVSISPRACIPDAHEDLQAWLPVTGSNMNPARRIELPSDLTTCRRCFDAVLAHYQSSGRVWNPEGVDQPFANYLAAWLLAELDVPAAQRQAFEDAQRWFEMNRNRRGYWWASDKGLPIEATARACVALLLQHSREQLETVRAALVFILDCQQPDGSWSGEFSGGFRAGHPYHGTMLPVSFAIQLALRTCGPTDELRVRLERQRAKLQRFLEHRFDKNRFANRTHTAEGPILALSWIARIYANVEGKHDGLRDAAAADLRLQLDEVTALSTQELYNVLHSLALLGASIDEPVIVKALGTIKHRLETEILAPPESAFRHAAGTLLAYIKLWRAHPTTAPYIRLLIDEISITPSKS